MNIIFVKQVRKGVEEVAVEADLLQTGESLVAEEQLPEHSEEQHLGRLTFRRQHAARAMSFSKTLFTLRGVWKRVTSR